VSDEPGKSVTGRVSGSTTGMEGEKAVSACGTEGSRSIAVGNTQVIWGDAIGNSWLMCTWHWCPSQKTSYVVFCGIFTESPIWNRWEILTSLCFLRWCLTFFQPAHLWMGDEQFVLKKSNQKNLEEVNCTKQVPWGVHGLQIYHSIY